MPGLSKMQSALDKINQSVATLNVNLLGVATNANYAAMQLAKMRPSRGGGGSRSSRAVGRPTGPRLARAGSQPPVIASPFANNPSAGMAYFARAAASGNPYAARMFGRFAGQANSLTRNQSRARAYLGFGGQGNSLSSLLSNVVSSTRFGRGGGQVLGHHVLSLLNSPGGASALSGLMGQGASAGGAGSGALGGGAAAVGALANPIGIAVAAVAAFAAIVSKGASVMNEWNNSLAQGGGSLGQARSANALNGALGVDISSVGKGLSPYAAARLGLNPNAGPFGDVNYNARGLRALDDIRNSRSRDEARRKAILAGDPNLSKVYDYSNGTYNALRNQPSNGFAGNAGALSGSFSRFATAFDNLIATMSGPATKSLSRSLDMISAGLEKFNAFLTYILNHLPKVIQDAIGWSQDKDRELRRNTDALNENTNAYREGTFGGGGRANSTPRFAIQPGGRGTGFRNVSYGGL